MHALLQSKRLVAVAASGAMILAAMPAALAESNDGFRALLGLETSVDTSVTLEDDDAVRVDADADVQADAQADVDDNDDVDTTAQAVAAVQADSSLQAEATDDEKSDDDHECDKIRMDAESSTDLGVDVDL